MYDVMASGVTRGLDKPPGAKSLLETEQIKKNKKVLRITFNVNEHLGL